MRVNRWQKAMITGLPQRTGGAARYIPGGDYAFKPKTQETIRGLAHLATGLVPNNPSNAWFKDQLKRLKIRGGMRQAKVLDAISKGNLVLSRKPRHIPVPYDVDIARVNLADLWLQNRYPHLERRTRLDGRKIFSQQTPRGYEAVSALYQPLTHEMVMFYRPHSNVLDKVGSIAHEYAHAIQVARDRTRKLRRQEPWHPNAYFEAEDQRYGRMTRPVLGDHPDYIRRYHEWYRNLPSEKEAHRFQFAAQRAYAKEMRAFITQPLKARKAWKKKLR